MNVIDQVTTENFSLFHGDCVEVLADLPSNSVDYSIFSPPFSSLYIYSESERDMGNVASDEEFQETYHHVAEELFRVTKPGRLVTIHVKDLVFYSNASSKGDRGLRDFSGHCIATHELAGWTYHSRVTVWRCPVREMTKAKPDGLLFKNFRTDAGRVRAGLPEYMVTFRKWSDGMDAVPEIVHDPNEFPLHVWQEWASPVWMSTEETNVLNAVAARDPEAEKHLCPMPLDLIERGVRLYSNPGDVVLSPFAGVGSEGFASIKAGRRHIGIELKESYFRQAVKNLRQAESDGPDLFRAPPALRLAGGGRL